MSFAALPHADLPGGGAAGGLGAALVSLGAELVPGADYVLEAIGFRVKREHPRFPLYRIDLGSLAKASKNVEAAVEAFLENLFNNEPAVGKAPARSNAGR